MVQILKSYALFALVVLAATAAGFASAGPSQAPASAPAPPPAQAGHPSGKLVIWGDIVNFDPPGTPNQCVAQTQFKRGQRVGFRMTAIDGGTGEVEDTAVLVAHVTYRGATIDVQMQWRGNQPFPADQYLRAPKEMWTGGWPVPADATIGRISYTVTARDRFGRTGTFTPFAAIPSQLAIVE